MMKMAVAKKPDGMKTENDRIRETDRPMIKLARWRSHTHTREKKK